MKTKDFLARLAELQDVEWILQPSGLVLHRTPPVRAYSIRYVSPSSSFWSPIEVLCFRLNQDRAVWYQGSDAARSLGMSRKTYYELRLAADECPGHLIALRAALLRACRLKEVESRPAVALRTRKVKKGKRN